MANRKKILIVEDQEDIRQIIKLHLETEGFQVIETSRGDDVIRIIEKEKPDLVTLDLKLPGVDGLELLRLIKSDPRPEFSKLPIVVVSVSAKDANKYEHVFTEFVSKPFEKHELLNAVKNVLSEIERQKKLTGKILVVDDEPDIVDIISSCLDSVGYKAIKAFDGKEAVALAKKELPDMIILDIKMPKLDGFEVMKILKKDKRTFSIPIIVLTGEHFTEAEREYGLRLLGAEKYFAKPIDMAYLTRNIKELLCEKQKS